MSDQGRDGRQMGRHPVLTSIMVIFGVILLFPGICAGFFMVGMGSGADSLLVLLWAVCFLISAGGIWLLIRAFR